MRASDAKVHPMVHTLRERRVALQMSQVQLADYVGCAVMTIVGYEHGRTTPQIHTIEAIAQVLGMKIVLQEGG